MQQKDENTLYLAKIVGETIKEFRLSKKDYSINKIAHEYGLDVGNMSRIENGITDIKVVTLWKIADALNIKPSKIFKTIENKLPKNFHFFEE